MPFQQFLLNAVFKNGSTKEYVFICTAIGFEKLLVNNTTPEGKVKTEVVEEALVTPPSREIKQEVCTPPSTDEKLIQFYRKTQCTPSPTQDYSFEVVENKVDIKNVKIEPDDYDDDVIFVEEVNDTLVDYEVKIGATPSYPINICGDNCGITKINPIVID